MTREGREAGYRIRRGAGYGRAMSEYASRVARLHGGRDGPSVLLGAANFNTEKTEATRSSRKAYDLRVAPRNALRKAQDSSFRGLRVASVSSVLKSSFFLTATPP
jgi:hypothetical protein